MGLFLNDLNPHGLSKEMVMAGWQHCSRLELVFEKEEQRSDELETSLKLADSWKKQGDDLLYSMIPRPVAERLRGGQNPMATCENFEQVSVLFGELHDESSSGETIQDGMAAVSTLNAAFSAFDDEIQTPMVYKVETVGYVYMAVSGAPDINPLHAEHAADLALRMIKRIKDLNIPGVTVKIGKKIICFISFTIFSKNYILFFIYRNSFRISCCRSCWFKSTKILFVWRYS